MVPFYSISQHLGIDQDDMSLGIDVYNLATFCKAMWRIESSSNFNNQLIEQETRRKESLTEIFNLKLVSNAKLDL